ncbi:hypothetical protein ASD45_08635 [Pseudolabrys sp. Root1462]|uniref:acyltransferase family protein n=1 Tax=Pseudolabrys sp. Root1462 TaxID=1736466 RepID=UPI0007024038|nr:acyltransferase [Pseudolabrys sp. Root1462]KQZ00919.1 hypothetical protein ASD45_08635 [Pseudolabrys sp. Root1462]
MAITSARREYLDGLRGFASLVVLIGHLILAVMPSVITFNPNDTHTRFDPTIGGLPIAFLWNGNGAVCVFFVLSGFVLSDLFHRSSLDVPAQVVRRYVRLALPMLLTGLLPYLLMRTSALPGYDVTQVTHSGWLGSWYHFGPSGREMVSEMLAGAFVSGKSLYNSNLWTMRVELIGSIAVFVISALSSNRAARVACFMFYIWLYPYDYSPLFAVGAIMRECEAAFVAQQNRTAALPIVVFMLGAFLCGVPSTSTAVPWFDWLPYIGKWDTARFWHELGAILVVASLLMSRGLQDMLATRPLLWLGRISFTLYLIHLPIVCAMVPAIVIALREYSYGLAGGAAALAAAAVSLGLATVLTPYVDRWPTRLSQKVGDAVMWLERQAVDLSHQRGGYSPFMSR